MKKKKENLKITKEDIKGFLSNSKCNQAILWLLTIPKEEWSDPMLLGYNKMLQNEQNEIWLIDYFEQNLSEEISEFVKWNDTFLNERATS